MEHCTQQEQKTHSFGMHTEHLSGQTIFCAIKQVSIHLKEFNHTKYFLWLQ